MAPTIYIYCRVSTKKQNDFVKGHVSLDSQEQACRAWIAQHLAGVGDLVPRIEVVREVGSAFNKSQPEFQQIVKNAKMGDTVVFYNITRFARNIEKLYLVNKLVQNKVNIQSVAEGCNYSNSAARHLFRTTLCFAMFESDQIGDRVRTSIAFRRQRGDFIGLAPYGYKAEKTDITASNPYGIRRKIEHPAEQAIIKRIADSARAGAKAKDIAATLNREGITKRNKTWNESTVKAILKPLNLLPPRRVSQTLNWATLVKNAIQSLAVGRCGVSRQAITRYCMCKCPALSETSVRTRVNATCRRLVASGDLTQVRQSFKLKAKSRSAAAKKRATRRR